MTRIDIPIGRSCPECRSGSLTHPAPDGSTTDRPGGGGPYPEEIAMSITSLIDAQDAFAAQLEVIVSATRYAFRK